LHLALSTFHFPLPNLPARRSGEPRHDGGIRHPATGLPPAPGS